MCGRLCRIRSTAEVSTAAITLFFVRMLADEQGAYRPGTLSHTESPRRACPSTPPWRERLPARLKAGQAAQLDKPPERPLSAATRSMPLSRLIAVPATLRKALGPAARPLL